MAASSAESPEGPSLRLDLGFGPVAEGWQRVGQPRYSSSLGYGWESTAGLRGITRGVADPLTRDFSRGTDQTFLIDLPDGTYQVTAVLGDPARNNDQMEISAEGAVIFESLDAPGRDSVQASFRVTVDDGQLNLRFRDGGGSDPHFALAGLAIDPVAPGQPSVSTGGTYEAAEGQVVTLQAEGFDPNGSESDLSYAWDLDGDGRFETSGASVDVLFEDDGAFRIPVQVTDAEGYSTVDSASVMVTNVRPSAELVAPNRLPVGEPITFEALATDASPIDEQVGFTYAWSFGSGRSASGARPTVTFEAAETIEATVTVTDKDGGATTVRETIQIGQLGGMHDPVPDFAAEPTIVSIADGPWSDPSSWNLDRIPTTDDVVSVQHALSYSTTVSPDLAVVAIQEGGTLTFSTTQDTEMLVGTLIVEPEGTLTVGTVAQPVQADVTARIVIADRPFDLDLDPTQIGNGLIGLGTVHMHGAEMDSTFVRMAAEPSIGDTTLRLAEPVSGWQVGDRLFLPDSRQLIGGSIRATTAGPSYEGQFEVVTLSGISPDGRTLTLSAPLRFDHPGARDADGVLRFLPHVANLSRNVMVESENGLGTRGHTVFMGRADVDLRYVQFNLLGRTTLGLIDDTRFDRDGEVTHIGTNQSGRYPLQFRDLLGPETPQANGFQYTSVGNSITCSLPEHEFKWGLVIHESHYGLVQDNVVHNWGGAGLVAEEGSETANVIEGNFVGRIFGNGRRAQEVIGDTYGVQGAGVWLRGPDNIVRDNVAANIIGTNTGGNSYGFLIVETKVQEITVPAAQGEAPSVTRNIHEIPVREFVGNEAYGTIGVGFSNWFIGSYGSFDAIEQIPESVIQDMKVWHIHDKGIYNYPSTNMVFDGYTALGDLGLLEQGNGARQGFFSGDYLSDNLVIRNADIQNFRTGIAMPAVPGLSGSPMTVEGGSLRNHVNINVHTMYTTLGGDSDFLQPRQIRIDGVRFGDAGSEAAIDLEMKFEPGRNESNVIQLDQVFVTSYNGVAGDDFQLFYEAQRDDVIVPETLYASNGGVLRLGAPEPGLTNQEAWDQHGIAIAGAIAPNAAFQRERIVGLVMPS